MEVAHAKNRHGAVMHFMEAHVPIRGGGISRQAKSRGPSAARTVLIVSRRFRKTRKESSLDQVLKEEWERGRRPQDGRDRESNLPSSSLSRDVIGTRRVLLSEEKGTRRWDWFNSVGLVAESCGEEKDQRKERSEIESGSYLPPPTFSPHALSAEGKEVRIVLSLTMVSIITMRRTGNIRPISLEQEGDILDLPSCAFSLPPLRTLLPRPLSIVFPYTALTGCLINIAFFPHSFLTRPLPPSCSSLSIHSLSHSSLLPLSRLLLYPSPAFSRFHSPPHPLPHSLSVVVPPLHASKSASLLLLAFPPPSSPSLSISLSSLSSLLSHFHALSMSVVSVLILIIARLSPRHLLRLYLFHPHVCSLVPLLSLSSPSFSTSWAPSLIYARTYPPSPTPLDHTYPPSLISLSALSLSLLSSLSYFFFFQFFLFCSAPMRKNEAALPMIQLF
ncbi:hypothetical protein C7M84_020294 [Penaeus vannamei]|uniref:Uncharacterized protein n=1 Tax=Penaeus vannamei TaxID=6689 RepID=A0A3R7MHH4_PENVA|nr:hypothetical protein C7M84_020294 [Penaeus vannamei]